MSLVTLLALFIGPPPDLSRLGADSFDVREAETDRSDCFLLALQLPASHPDPEVDFRVKRLRGKWLPKVDPRYWERALHASDYGAWLDWYFLPNRSQYTLQEVYDEAASDNQRLRDLLTKLNVPFEQEAAFILNLALSFEDFRDICDYERHVAPLPREVSRP